MQPGQAHFNYPKIKSFDRIYRMFRMVRWRCGIARTSGIARFPGGKVAVCLGPDGGGAGPAMVCQGSVRFHHITRNPGTLESNYTKFDHS